LKYMTIMSWKPEMAQKVTELFIAWKVPQGMKFLYGPCTVLGQNKSVSIWEGTDEAHIKTDRYWRHTCMMETFSIVDSADIAKAK
jgi:hypothetical protein